MALVVTMTLGLAGSALRAATVSVPLTTADTNKISLGTFAGGTVVQLDVTGTGDIAPGQWSTTPDGSLVTTASAPFTYNNPGAAYASVPDFPGGDGFNRFPGGGANYDYNGSGWPFAGKQTTDTTDPAAIRFGTLVGTFAASPARKDWFYIGYGGFITVPEGGATLYVAVNETFSANDTGSYAVTYKIVTPGGLTLPLTTDAAAKIALGPLPGGAVVRIGAFGSGDLTNSTYQTYPDGSLAAPATGSYPFANAGAAFPAVSGGDGFNHFVGGGSNYDHSGSGYGFAGTQTTDTTNSGAIRVGAVVGTFVASPARADWFLVGKGGAFTVPAGGGTLYLAVNDSVSGDNHGSYTLWFNVTLPATFSLPLGTNAPKKMILGVFGGGTFVRVTATGSGDLVDSRLQVNPDGSLAAVAGAPWAYANANASYPSVPGFPAGDGVNHFPGGGLNFDGTNWGFAGTQTTDTTDPTVIREGAIVGTYVTNPARSDWFYLGANRTITIPNGGATLYMAVDESTAANSGDDNHGNYTVSAVTVAAPNDNFAEATTLSGMSVSVTAANTDASKETGEPNHAGSPGGKSLWWKWTAPKSGPVEMNTIGSNFSTLLAVYTGTSVSALTPVASNFGSGAGSTSKLSFTATAGTTYRIAVDSVAAASGNITLSFSYSSYFFTLAGTALSSGSTDGTGSAALFSNVSGIAVDSSGTVYVADRSNNTVRMITPSGVVTTLAGQAGVAGKTDGTGSGALFDGPTGVAVDAGGVVYVADRNNGAIRKIAAGGVVTTFATGFADPSGLAVGSDGTVYVADTSNCVIRKVSPLGEVSILAGAVLVSGSTDGTGSDARFNNPWSVAVDGSGNVYVADYGNYLIRAITPAGVVTTLAGSVGVAGGSEGAGSAARFNFPNGIAVGPDGLIYVCDRNHTIRRITKGGAVTSLAGGGGITGSSDGTGSAARFNFPGSVTVDSSGNLYVADTNNFIVRKGVAAIPPSIDTPPSSQTVAAAGATTAFSVSASGAGTLTYQWLKNGTAIAGATNSSLGFASVQASDLGSYTVTVSTVLGSITSGAVTLSATNAPTISTQPAAPGSPVVSGNSTSLSVTASGGGTLTYQWRRNGLPIASATNPSLSLTGVTLTSAGVYDVVVTSDGFATVTSTPVILSVAPTTYPGALVVDDKFDLPFEREMMDFSTGPVYQVQALAGGKFLAAGAFTRVNGTPRAGLARFNADGTLDSTFVPPALNGDVRTFLVQPDGRVVIAGSFFRIGNVSVPELARLNTDGSHDTSFTAPFLNGSPASALALQADGRILVGGDLSTGNGISPVRTGLVRLNTNGTFDATFDAALNAGAVVRALAIQNVGGADRLLVGGTFTQVGPTSRGNLARLDLSNGALDTGFLNSATGADGAVRAILAADSTGRIVVGGAFSTFNGVASNRLARLDAATGARDSGLADLGANGDVLTLALQSDGQVVVGGSFTGMNTAEITRGRAMRLSPAGAADSFNPNFNGDVLSVAIASSGDVLLAGSFTTAGGSPAPRLVRYSPAAVRDTAVTPVLLAPGAVSALVNVAGGVLVSGNFTHVGGAAANAIVRLTAAGALDSTYNSGGAGFVKGATVQQLEPLGDGRVWAAGSFNSYNGTTRNFVLRLNSDGSLDTAFTSGTGFNGVPAAVLALPGGQLLAAGGFSVYNDNSRSGLIRLNANGTIDTSLVNPPGGSVPGSSLVLARQIDGRVLVGGNFTSFAGVSPANRLVRLNLDGTVDSAFNANVGNGPNQVITALVVRPDGRIYAGGGFDAWQGNGSYRFAARLNSDGSLDGGFIPPPASNGSLGFGVQALLLQADGKLIERGLGGLGINNTFGLGRLATDGSVDNTLTLNGAYGISSQDRATLLLDDGTLYAGGFGTLFLGGPTVRLGLAHLVPFAAPAITTPPIAQIKNPGDNASFSVVATGGALNTYQWSRNGTAIAGATGATLSLTGVTIADAGSYTVTITNSLGSITSSAVALTGSAPVPTVSQSPQPITVIAGAQSNPLFTVVAAPGSGGGPLSYQWRRNGFSIASATNASYAPATASVIDSDVYDVLVIDGLTAVNAGSARLTVVPTDFPQGLRVDSTFAPIIESDLATVNAIAVDTSSGANGRFYAAGQFNRIAGVYRDRLARFNSDGSFDSSWTPVFISGTVNALVVQPGDGKIVIGGSFSVVGNTSRNFIARLNANGTLDTGFNVGGNNFNSNVNTLVLQPDGKIVVGGFFNTYNNTTRNGLARLNADGSLDTFDPGLNSGASVSALLLSGTNLLVGGTFSTVGVTPRTNVALVDTSGAVVGSFNPGSGPTSAVLTLATASGGGFVLGGNFTNYNGTAVGRIARVDANGVLDTAFANVTTGIGFTSQVNALLVDGSGNIYVGGSFTNYGAASVSRLARLTSAGALDGGFTTTVNASVSSLALGADGNPIVGGFFSGVFLQGSASSTARKSLLRLGVDAGIYLKSLPNVTIRSAGTVNAAALVPGGAVLIAGNFNWINDTAANNVARLAANGTLDSAFMTNVGIGFNSTVNSLVLQPDGRMVFGGIFSFYNGTHRDFLARLNGDGTLDPSFNTDTSFVSGSVSTVLPAGGGRLVVAGNFTSYNGTTRNGVLRLNADGSLDGSFDPGAGPVGGAVNGAALLDDGRVVVFGNFTSFRGIVRAGLARLTTTGNDDGLDPGTGVFGAFSPALNAVAIQPDGKLVLGGSFSSYNNATRANFARALTGGGNDAAFLPNASPNSPVTAVVLEPQLTGAPRLIARGSFASAGNFSIPRPLLARYNADGTLDPSLTVFGVNATTSTNSPTERAVLTLDDGRVIVAGSGFNLEGQDHFGLVRLINAVPPSVGPFATTPAGGEVRAGATVTITGTNFLNVSNVLFGTVPAASFTVVDPTQITAVVPAGAASNPITVVTPYGSSTSSALLGIAPDLRLRNPLGTVAFLDGLAFGNGIHVAVGSPGDILTSTDGGETWALTYTSRPATQGPRAVVYSTPLNLFVAVGDNGTILTSSNGLVWTPRLSNTSSSFTGVTHAAGKLIAVTNSSTVATSTDGINWFPLTGSSNTGISTGLNAVAASGSIIVGVGNNGNIYTSTNGTSWSSAGSPTSNTLNRIAFTNGLFLAVGNNGTVLSSSNGTAWTLATWPAAFSSASLFAATYDPVNHRYVAAGFSTVAFSTDAITWSASNVADLDVRSLLYDGTRLVAGGFPGSAYRSDDGGVTWALKNSLVHRNLRAAAVGDGHYVVVGNNGTYAHSLDGVAWSTGAIQANAFWSATDVAYANGRFVTVGGGGLFLSPDGQAWTNQTPQSFDFSNSAVAYGGGRFVTVTSNSNSYRSLDGTGWTPGGALPALGSRGVAYGNNTFVAVGDNGTIATSADGVTWTSRASGTGNNLQRVRYANGSFVAVGSNSTVLTSPDGTTWTPRTLGTSGISLTDVAFGDSYWLAVAGSSSVYVSSDNGVTWTSVNPTSHALTGALGVVYGNGRFVVTGLSGQLLSSNPAPDTLLIATQPPSGNTSVTSLTVSATGPASINYQWYAGVSGDTSNPVGGNSPTLNFGALSSSARYWVRVTSGTSVVDSATANLLGAPTIVQQPQAVAANEFGTATFTVTAIGSAPLNYQWSRNGTPISGANAAVYTVPLVTATTAGNYSVTVSNAANPAGVTSVDAALTVTSIAPSVSGPIATSFGISAVQSHTAGSVTAFVTGTAPINFAWAKNGVPIAGATGTITNTDLVNGNGFASAEYFIPNWQPGDAGSYSVTLTNSVNPGGVTATGPIIVNEEAGWKVAAPVPTANALTGVNVINDQFVVTGVRGSRFATYDGATFQQLPSLSTNSANAYAFNNDPDHPLHVLVGSFGAYSTSTDGVTWTSRQHGQGGAFPGAVVFGAGKFAMGLDNGTVLTSTDAVTWTVQTVSVDTDSLAGLAFGNNLFAVATGAGKIFTSPDAVTWTQRTSPGVATAARPDLVAHWNFDETSGPVAHDTKNAFPGTLGGNVTFVSGGVSGNAASFDGAPASFINAGTSFPGFTSGNFTLSVWVKTSMGVAGGPIHKHDTGTFNGYFLSLNTSSGYGVANRAYFYDSTSPDNVPVSTTNVTDDQWHHLVGVYTAGGTAALYVDGVLQATKPAAPINANGSPLLIGGVNVGGTTPTGVFTGLIDDVQVYGGALAAGEVAYLYTHPGNDLSVAPAPEFGLKFLNGQFVTLAHGIVYTSADGLAWVSHPTGIGSDITDLAFAAIPGGGVAALPPGSHAVVSANPVYVATTDAGRIYTSSDLVTWTERTTGTTQHLRRVAYSASLSRFLAIGGDSGTPVVLTSFDGSSWTNTASSLTGNASTPLVALANSSTGLVGVGSAGLLVRSTDGEFWNVVTSPTQSFNYTNVAYSGGAFIAVGSNGTINRSTDDGFSWAPVPVSGLSSTLRGVGFVNGNWFITGDNGTLLKSTNGGQTWISLTAGVSTSLTGLAFGNSTYVLVGNGGLVRTSGDLSTWTPQSANTGADLRGVAFGNNTFLAVGNNGAIRSSSNGTSWTTRDLGIPDSYSGVGYNGSVGGFAIAGGWGYVIVTVDGVNYAVRGTGVAGSPGRVNGLAYYNQKLFAAGSAGTIAVGLITPSIAQQPENVAVLAGSPAAFRVIAAGSAAPVGYQWFKEGVPIAGATTAELKFASAQLSDAARYTVSLATSFGGTISVPARLTINAPPTISASPVATTAIVGGTLTLNVGVTGSGPFTFTWQFLDPNVVEGSFVTVGTTSGPQFTLPNFSAGNVGSYRVLVSNAFGTNVASASIAVTAAPTASTWIADPSFARPQFRATVPPGRVTPSPDGTKLYVTWNNGGTITGANHQRVGPVLRFNNDATGTLDATFTSGLAGLTDALAVAFQSNGQLLVGGVDAAENGDTGAPVFRVFRLNADGSRDASYRSPTFAGMPRFMAVQPDDRLLVSEGGTTPAPTSLLRLNTNGSRDLSFLSPVFDGTSFIFTNPVIDGSGRILIGGTFTQVNGVARPAVARLNPNGSLDPTFAPSGFTLSGGSQVRGLAIQTLGGNAGKVLVAGGALTVGANNCAVIRLDGTTGALDAGFPAITQSAAGMVVRARGVLLNPVDDSFTLVGGTLARFSANGVSDGTFTRPVFATPQFNEFLWIAGLPDGRMLVPIDELGATINGTPVAGVARFNANGSFDGAFAPGPIQNEIYSDELVVQTDSRPLLFGPFTTVNGVARAGLARFNLDGSLDSLALTGVPNLLGVDGAQVRSDGRYLARVFSGASPATATGDVKVFDANGALNAALFTLDPAVATVASNEDPDAQLLADDSILLGSVTPQRVLDGNTYFKHVLANGTLDVGFSPSAITYGQVYRNGSNQVLQVVAGEFHLLAHYSDGRTLAAVTTGGYPQNATSLFVTLKRFNANGTADGTFSAPAISEPTVTLNNVGLVDAANANANIAVPVVQLDRSPIYTAQILPDNRILVITGFVAGFSPGGLTRLNVNGSVDTSFSVGTGAELRYRPGRLAHINSVTVGPDGKYWVTGIFDTFNGRAAPGIVRLNTDGSVDPTFAVDFSYRSFHTDDARLVFAPDGSAWLAGSYAKPGDLMPFALTHLIVPSAPALVAPVIAAQAVNNGGNITLSAAATGSPAPTYVWRLNGNLVPGASSATLTIAGATPANAGDYTVTITNAFGSFTAGPLHLDVLTRDLLTASTRATVPVGGSIATGFTIEGSVAKNVLIRAVGPTLAAAPFNLPGMLADPKLTVFDGSLVQVGANNDWGTNANSAAIAAAANPSGAFPLIAGGKDAALLLTLNPGTYTAVLESVDATVGGVGLVEVYDADTGNQLRLVMLTARGPVGTGTAHVTGFVVAGTGSKKILVRALGESLGQSNGILTDTVLSVYQGATLLDSNDDWPGTPDITAAVATAGLRPLGETLDSTLLLSLSPGAYTAQVVGYSGSIGETFLEIAQIDAGRAAAIAPAITYLARNQTAILGTTAEFGVNVLAKPAPTYQWRRNGVNLVDGGTIFGTTSAVLSITNVQAADAANYDVVVTNGAGAANTVTSPARTLSVLPDFHSADTNHDHRIDLLEITRVLQLFAYTSGATQTGEYHTQAGTEDGFAPGPGPITTYHSADINHDGKISVTELSRVILLYNYVNGTVRTGEYHPEVGTEDGFAPGPAVVPHGL